MYLLFILGGLFIILLLGGLITKEVNNSGIGEFCVLLSLVMLLAAIFVPAGLGLAQKNYTVHEVTNIVEVEDDVYVYSGFIDGDATYLYYSDESNELRYLKAEQIIIIQEGEEAYIDKITDSPDRKYLHWMFYSEDYTKRVEIHIPKDSYIKSMVG